MTIYLNGDWLPIEEASVSVLDRGFIFGDGVYEVIPVYSRRAFRLDEHLQRLQHSLDCIQLLNPHSKAEWNSLISTLIEKNDGEDQYLYLHITRGVARRDHPFPNPPVPPTVFLMSTPLPPPAAALIANGTSAVTAQDNRWLHCDIKAISLLPNVLLRQIAVDAGCAETLLLRSESVNPPFDIAQAFLTEGAASNIFVVKNGTLLAPPKSHLMLPGITYDVILEIASLHHIPHQVRRIAASEVFDADELLLSSSTREIQAITTLDGKAVGSGLPGPVFQQINQYYQEFKRNVMRAQ